MEMMEIRDRSWTEVEVKTAADRNRYEGTYRIVAGGLIIDGKMKQGENMMLTVVWLGWWKIRRDPSDIMTLLKNGALFFWKMKGYYLLTSLFWNPTQKMTKKRFLATPSCPKNIPPYLSCMVPSYWCIVIQLGGAAWILKKGLLGCVKKKPALSLLYPNQESRGERHSGECCCHPLL